MTMSTTSLRPSAWLLAGLERTINRLLVHDRETLQALEQLAGKVIRIEITQPSWHLFLLPGSHGISLEISPPERVDVCISGRPSALLGMVTGQQDAGSQGHVAIRGDIHLAQRLQQILKSAAIDWEELLSSYIGDMAAHHMGRVGRELRYYVAAAGRGFVAQFSEYIQHEQQLFLSRQEAERFGEAVDTLRDDVERARQRLQRLEQQLGMRS